MVRGGKVLVEDKLLPVGVQLIGRPFGYSFFASILFSLANSFFASGKQLFWKSHTYSSCARGTIRTELDIKLSLSVDMGTHGDRLPAQ